MGLIAPASGHHSKIFRRLLGTRVTWCGARPASANGCGCANPGHAIAHGLPGTWVRPRAGGDVRGIALCHPQSRRGSVPELVPGWRGLPLRRHLPARRRQDLSLPPSATRPIRPTTMRRCSRCWCNASCAGRARRGSASAGCPNRTAAQALEPLPRAHALPGWHPFLARGRARAAAASARRAVQASALGGRRQARGLQADQRLRGGEIAPPIEAAPGLGPAGSQRHHRQSWAAVLQKRQQASSARVAGRRRRARDHRHEMAAAGLQPGACRAGWRMRRRSQRGCRAGREDALGQRPPAPAAGAGSGQLIRPRARAFCPAGQALSASCARGAPGRPATLRGGVEAAIVGAQARHRLVGDAPRRRSGGIAEEVEGGAARPATREP